MVRNKVPANINEALREQLSDDKIITPPLREYLAQGEQPLRKDIAEWMVDQLSTPKRDRSGSFSASQISECKRRQELAYIGMPVHGSTDPRLQHIFSNGTFVHLRWQSELLNAGLLKHTEVTYMSKSERFRGTLDGVGVATRGRFAGRDFGFELKSANQWRYTSQDASDQPDEKTNNQAHFNMLLSGLDLFVVIVEDKNTQNWHEWVILRDESRIAQVKGIAQELAHARKTKQLHSMLPQCKRGQGEWKRCPFGGDGGACINSGVRWPKKL